MIPRRLFGALLAICLLFCSVSASAAGITLGRFGGLYGHPNAEGGLALFWNPSLTSTDTGFFFAVDGTLVYRFASYDRAIDPTASPDEQLVNSGEGTASAIGVLPYLALGYSFSIDDSVNLAFSGGIIPTFGGVVSYDKNLAAPSVFPGAVDGPQRWSTIESSLMVLNYTGGVSATVPDWGLSLGFTVAYVTGDLDTVRARNLNRTDDVVDADGNLQEGRVHFAGSDTAVAFSVGASYALDNVRASFTYRNQYDLRIQGPARQAYATNEPTVEEAYLDLPLPHIFQTAITVEFGKLVLTGITDFTAWSVMKENDVLASDSDEQLLLIPRDLNNTFSLRAIVGWMFSDTFELSGTIGFDPSAVPLDTLDASLFDSNKLNIGLGARWELENMQILASYVHDIFFTQRPENSRQEPPQNGTFNDTRGFFNLSIGGQF